MTEDTPRSKISDSVPSDSVLEKWEAEANRKVYSPYELEALIPNQRILALIDLIRKKDEALKEVLENGVFYSDVEADKYRTKMFRALDLTEQLK